MAIEFRCGSIVSFDPQQKKYVTCDAKISVGDESSGSVVKCPKCKNKIEVPYAAPPDADLPASGPAIPEIEEAPLADLGAEQDHAPVGDDLVEGPAVKPRQTKTGSPHTNSASAAPFKATVVTPPTPAFTQPESQLGYSNFTRDNTCLKCGADIRSAVDTCLKCGRPLPAHLQKSERTLDAKHKLVGFQLWIASLFSSPDTQPPSAAINVFHMGVGCAVASACIGLIYFGGIFGFLTAIPLIVVSVMYAFTVIKWNQLKKDPFTKLYWWQKLLWKGVLHLNRLFKWANSTDPAKRHRVLDMRYTTVDEDKLRFLDGIAHSHVLDLDGQPITDRGLLYLHDFKQLRRIVLTRTSVTDEGVFHLQQAIPRAWIWYD